MLTKIQKRGLKQIKGYMLKNDGLAPSMKEIAELMGYESVNSARELLRALERKGYIKRKPGVARAITLTELGFSV